MSDYRFWAEEVTCANCEAQVRQTLAALRCRKCSGLN